MMAAARKVLACVSPRETPETMTGMLKCLIHFCPDGSMLHNVLKLLDAYDEFSFAILTYWMHKGLCVLDEGNVTVIELLKYSGNLLSISEYRHRYPYDWRTKKLVILPATAQWFARLDTLHERGKHVLKESVQMRSWGLPIPVFYHKITNEPLISEESIDHLQSILKTYVVKNDKDEILREGADCWWDLSVRELLPPSLQDQEDEYEKGTDTLGVWFDSGCSWHAVLSNLVEPNEDGQVRVVPVVATYITCNAGNGTLQECHYPRLYIGRTGQ
ncbi:hypothetical protein PsorP6_004274 [Peronosclerospora sorghi]|uniref:Uncharacterized protein n=1 Tax=Peronosclerospora sorghi TaxID=230839 RepID=A0ACC0VJX4_9STRA|nr:hypothetical protein PsorP6_004274 [Peronosclerospora sorghi]